MALKRKISKDEYEKLPDVLKSEYKEKGGEYFIDVEGDDDASALKRAKDREKQRADEAEKARKELQEKLDELTDNDARKKGDVEKLEKSLKEKHEKELSAEREKHAKLQNSTKTQLIESAASALAAKLSTVPSLMAKAIKERLTVDFDEDSPTLKILDATGKASSSTLADLEKEFLANKEYSSILIGSKASGGGASKDGLQTKNKMGGGAANEKSLNLASVPAKDLVAMLDNESK